ncbi:endonuclease/exonuclease/phosphatase (EEP) superfamily protein YafD [Streptomyces griseus]
MRLVASVLVTWAVLVVLLLAPSPLPEHWRYYIYSPASVGLWMLTMLVAPPVVCAVKWQWIKSGSR